MTEKKNKFNRLEAFMSEGLVVASLLLFMFIFTFFAFVKVRQLPDIAAIVPAEQTLAFGVVSVPTYLKSVSHLPEESPLSTSSMKASFNTLFGSEIENLDWFGGDLAFAFIAEEPVFILKTRSRTKTLEYYESLLTEGELLEAKEFGSTKIYSYPSSHPINFAFFGNLVAVSSSSHAIQLMAKVKNGDLSSIKNTSDYRNVRSRLPYFTTAFFYVNLPESRLYLAQILARMGIKEPGYLEPLLQVFPAAGLTVRMEEDGWYVENFTAVDKSSLNGGLLRNEDKYEKKFLSWTPENFLFEWGGQNFHDEILRMKDLLGRSHPTASLLFESVLRAKVNQTFGGDIVLEDEIYPLIDGEYWFAWNPVEAKDFALILELDPNESAQAFLLKDRFVQNYSVREPVLKMATMLNGNKIEELQADVHSLSQKDLRHNEAQYSKIIANNQAIAFVAIREDLVIITKNEETLTGILDRMDDSSLERSIASISKLLPGSEEILSLNISALPDDNVLANLLKGFSRITATRKIFDDGIFTRQSLIFE